MLYLLEYTGSETIIIFYVKFFSCYVLHIVKKTCSFPPSISFSGYLNEICLSKFCFPSWSYIEKFLISFFWENFQRKAKKISTIRISIFERVNSPKKSHYFTYGHCILYRPSASRLLYVCFRRHFASIKEGGIKRHTHTTRGFRREWESTPGCFPAQY
jgi:hypothetical protein